LYYYLIYFLFLFIIINSGMYPPQDAESIHKNTRELRKQVDLFLDVIATLDTEVPKLTAKKLVGVVRTLVANLTEKICAT
jgi:hypothetical protein